MADAITGPFPKAPAVFCEPFGGALMSVSHKLCDTHRNMLTQLHFLLPAVFL
jgi:hypothetical protein